MNELLAGGGGERWGGSKKDKNKLILWVKAQINVTFFALFARSFVCWFVSQMKAVQSTVTEHGLSQQQKYPFIHCQDNGMLKRNFTQGNKEGNGKNGIEGY